MAEVASLSSKSTAFHIEKLDGTNFPFWKEQIYNVLVQKKQVRPIKLKGVKPESMDQEEWAEVDELARSTIMLSMTKTVYYNVNKCVTMICGASYAPFTLRRVLRHKFTG